MWSVEVILKENNLKRSCSRWSNYRSRTPGGVARSTAREEGGLPPTQTGGVPGEEDGATGT